MGTGTSIYGSAFMSLKNEFRGGATVTLHTNFANRAIRGRTEKTGKPPIPSLYQFNTLARTIFKSCQLDDPFAWFALGQIEDKLEKVEQELKKISMELDQVLRINDDRIQIEDAVSLKPIAHTVHVSHYGFRLLDMIASYDRVCCDGFNAIHRGRIPTKRGYDLMDLGANVLRSAASAGDGYVFTGITRKDLEQGNQKARNAIKRLVASQFIDQTKFNGFEDMCRFFAAYQPKTTYGPPAGPFQGPETDEPEEKPMDLKGQQND